MASDPVALLLGCHGAALRILSDRAGMHYQGLGVAARDARKKGFLSAKMCNRMIQVDIAMNLMRHITAASCRDTLAALVQEAGAEDENKNEATEAARGDWQVDGQGKEGSETDLEPQIYMPCKLKA